MTLRASVIFLASIYFVATSNADPVKFTAGNWEATVTMSLAEGGEAIVTDEFSGCMSEAETRNSPSDLAAAFAGGAECVQSNVQSVGNTITFDMVCAKGTLQSASYTMERQSDYFLMAGPQKIRLKNGALKDIWGTISARRTGACS